MLTQTLQQHFNSSSHQPLEVHQGPAILARVAPKLSFAGQQSRDDAVSQLHARGQWPSTRLPHTRLHIVSLRSRAAESATSAESKQANLDGLPLMLDAVVLEPIEVCLLLRHSRSEQAPAPPAAQTTASEKRRRKRL